jgi:dihydropteroate synthase-like protein
MHILGLMKVLAVTGRLAQDLVRASARDADVLVLDTDIAAFITPQMLIQAAPKGYDLILLPGAITADFTEAEKALGMKIRLGPKHAADLGFVLKHMGEVELSRSVPACVLFEDAMRKDALSTLEQLESDAVPALTIKDLKIGGNSRMKVLAEIVDATMLTPKGLAEKIRYYEDQGADMIDLGLPLNAVPSWVSSALKAAKEATALPVSIDTIRPALILTGVEAGADLILSLNGKNLPKVGDAVAKAGVPAVVIPGPGTISLEENLNAALAFGIKVIADPVLNPPLLGLAASLQGYMDFRKKYPDVPLFFGVGNVTELLDADSQGTNALLAAIGAEIGADILFTPEYSPKARGSVKELKTASEMMMLALNRKTPPKDLGVDLLLLKEKKPRQEEALPLEYEEASAEYSYEMDPAGSFRISIADGKIVARHESVAVVGSSARDILNTLIDRGLVSRLDHAGYLGRELEKAEVALALGRTYIQDEPLLPSSLEKS